MLLEDKPLSTPEKACKAIFLDGDIALSDDSSVIVTYSDANCTCIYERGAACPTPEAGIAARGEADAGATRGIGRVVWAVRGSSIERIIDSGAATAAPTSGCIRRGWCRPRGSQRTVVSHVVTQQFGVYGFMLDRGLVGQIDGRHGRLKSLLSCHPVVGSPITAINQHVIVRIHRTVIHVIHFTSHSLRVMLLRARIPYNSLPTSNRT